MNAFWHVWHIVRFGVLIGEAALAAATAFVLYDVMAKMPGGRNDPRRRWLLPALMSQVSLTGFYVGWIALSVLRMPSTTNSVILEGYQWVQDAGFFLMVLALVRLTRLSQQGPGPLPPIDREST